MFAITGITGKVGGEVARRLLRSGQPVRAVVRDLAKGEAWKERGCEVVEADIVDAAALASAFSGADGVFVLLPPAFDPTPGFPEAKAIVSAVKSALIDSRPNKVVALSTIGAQATQTNLLTQLSIMERELATLPMPVAFLRAGWFMENTSLDLASARELGVIQSFLQPLDKPVPMVATEDVGRVAAELLQQDWTGSRIEELEGPHRVTPLQLAATLAKLLGRPVTAQATPRSTWETLFRSQGMRNPLPRMKMLDGFNEGWIEFESGKDGSHKGSVELETVLRSLVQRDDA